MSINISWGSYPRPLPLPPAPSSPPLWPTFCSVSLIRAFPRVHACTPRTCTFVPLESLLAHSLSLSICLSLSLIRVILVTRVSRVRQAESAERRRQRAPDNRLFSPCSPPLRPPAMINSLVSKLIRRKEKCGTNEGREGGGKRTDDASDLTG